MAQLPSRYIQSWGHLIRHHRRVNLRAVYKLDPSLYMLIEVWDREGKPGINVMELRISEKEKEREREKERVCVRGRKESSTG